MCGRFTLRNLDDLKTRYGDIEFRSSYNIGPGQKLLALTNKLQSIEWGFSPYWADKPFNLVNARIETLREKPSFSNSNRCLVPSDGWYEWKRTSIEKIPFYHYINNSLIHMAGIYNDKGCAIVTTKACNNIMHVHHRQPLLLEGLNILNWIEGKISINFNLSKKIQFYPVKKYVNYPYNNDAECIERI